MDRHEIGRWYEIIFFIAFVTVMFICPIVSAIKRWFRKPKKRRCKDCENYDLAMQRECGIPCNKNRVDDMSAWYCHEKDKRIYKRKRFRFWAAK